VWPWIASAKRPRNDGFFYTRRYPEIGNYIGSTTVVAPHPMGELAIQTRALNRVFTPDRQNSAVIKSGACGDD
jgi:hypothetical protein